MKLDLPPIINAAGLLPFLGVLGSVPEVESEITLDFSALRRVSPAGLAALVSTVRRWQHRSRRVHLVGLERCTILGYLQRMDVMDGCGVTVKEGFARHAARGRFVPVQPIEDVDRMTKDIAACLAPGGDEYGHPMSSLYDLSAYVIGELGANVRQHSGGAGYVAAQVNASEGLVRIAVADNGRGIRQSFVDAGLSWSHGLDDVEAIRKALEPRVSSKGEPVNQGVGLTLVSGLARLTEAWLMIASGTGVLQVGPRGESKAYDFPPGSRFHGTLIALTFRRDKLQDFYRLLDVAKQQAGLLAKRRIRSRFS